VLASPQALEGIAAQPGLELLLARDEAEFIHHAARVLRAAALPGAIAGVDMGACARQMILQDYQWEGNLQALGAMLDLKPNPLRQGTPAGTASLCPVQESEAP